MKMIDSLNGLAEWSGDWAAASLVEAAILLAVVGLVLVLARRRVSSSAAHLMMLVVLVKAVLPLGYPLPRPEIAGWHAAAVVLDPGSSEPISSTVLSGATNDVEVPHPSAVEYAAAPIVTRAPSAVLAPAAVQEVTTRFTWRALAMFVWLGVVMALVVRLLVCQRRLRRALAFGSPVDSHLRRTVRELAAQLGIRRPIAVIAGPDHLAPAVTGVLRPTLIVPRDLADRLSAEQVRWVLLHELAHVRRGDLYTLWLVGFVECVAFFNPAVWLAARWAEHHRECACDELAWRHASCDRSACGEAFLALLAQAAVKPRLTLGFLSTKRLAKRRLLRLVDARHTPHTSWTRVASLAVVCVLACGLFSVTQHASLAEGEVRVASTSSSSTNDEATKVDKVANKSTDGDLAARTKADIERIWEEQTRRIHSGRIVLNQLRLSNERTNPLQQGHELKRVSRAEVDAVLDSIDFRSDPNCLRKVRDGLLEGNLILDQPSARSVEIIWNGEASRWNWPGQLTVVLGGSKQVSYDPASRQADIVAGSAAVFASRSSNVADYLKSERWRMLVQSPPPQMGGMHKYDRRPTFRAVELLDGGMRRAVFDNFVRLRNNLGDDREVRMPLTWKVDKDGQLESVDECIQNHVRRQVGYQEYLNNIVAPRVGIDAEYSYKSAPDGGIEYGNLLAITITLLERAEFNMDVPPEAFRVAVPANTAVWERRHELKLRAAEVATEDVLTLFER